MRVLWRLITVVLLITAMLSGVSAVEAQGQYYIVVVKDEQRLYLAQGDPKAPLKTDVIKNFPVTTGALWTQKGLETPSGFFTIIDKSNNPVQGGYDFSDTGDVTLTPYFMRLDVPNRGGIGIHTYTGRTLELWRFGFPGGETTHGCIAGPPDQIIDLYKNYVRPGSTKVWVVGHPSEAFKDVPARQKPERKVVNGKTWQALESPTEQQFYSVDMVRPDLAWAVSGDATFIGDKYAWESNIYRWDGKSWNVDAEVPYWLHGLRMVNAQEGWAVGQNYMAGVRYTSGRWTQVDRPVPRVPYMSDVAVVSADNVWMGGGGGEIFSWDGSEWEINISPDILKTIRAMSLLPSGSGWAVGGGWNTASEDKETIPLIASFDGESWELGESPVNELWYGVDAVAEDDAWAVGSNGAIIRWNGDEWASVQSPTTSRLSSVSMINARDGWAVGDEKGVALHWDGKAWSAVALPVDEAFYEVTTTEDGAAMAVGSAGSIIQLVDAASAPAQEEVEATAVPVTPTSEAAEPQATPDTANIPDEPYATEVAQLQAQGTAPAVDVIPTSVEPTQTEEQEEAATPGATEQPLRTAATAESTGAPLAATPPAQTESISDLETEAAQTNQQDETFPVAPVAGGIGVLGVLAAAGTLAARRRA